MRLIALLALCILTSCSGKNITITIIDADHNRTITVDDKPLLCPCGSIPDHIWVDGEIVHARCDACAEGELCYMFADYSTFAYLEDK